MRPETFPPGYRLVVATSAATARGDKPRLFPLELSDEIAFDLETEDLIDGILPKIGVAMLYGKPGSVKTFISFDWLMSIAKGEPWAGRHVEQGLAVYIAAEGAGGLRKRKAGYALARGLPNGTPFALIPAAPNLGSEKGDLAALIATIEARNIKPAAICIDTASKSMGSGDENGGGMQTLINNAVALSLHFQCCVILVHHVGVGDGAEKRPRGFSGSTGGVDAQILSEREDKALAATLTVQKQKDGEDGVAFRVNLERVEVGTNKRGKVHSTLFVVDAFGVEAVPSPSTDKSKKEPPRQQRLLLDVIREAIEDVGRDMQPFANGPTVRAVCDDIVRERYYRRIAEPADATKDPDQVADRRRQAFNRAIKAVIDAKDIAAKTLDGKRFIWRL